MTAASALDPGGVLGDRQPPGLQRQVGVVQGVRAEALGVAESVADHPQLAPRAVTAGFFCRSEPAALLRGLANGALPSSTRPALSVLEVGEPEEHLAAHLEHLGQREWSLGAVSRSGMSSMVRALSVTSSPVRPSPRVAARTSRPSR